MEIDGTPRWTFPSLDAARTPRAPFRVKIHNHRVMGESSHNTTELLRIRAPICTRLPGKFVSESRAADHCGPSPDDQPALTDRDHRLVVVHHDVAVQVLLAFVEAPPLLLRETAGGVIKQQWDLQQGENADSSTILIRVWQCLRLCGGEERDGSTRTANKFARSSFAQAACELLN